MRSGGEVSSTSIRIKGERRRIISCCRLSRVSFCRLLEVMQMELLPGRDCDDPDDAVRRQVQQAQARIGF